MNVDILIVGGGLVGATLAAALGRSGMRIGLVEARETPSLPESGFDLRVSAVTLASRRVLESIGVWNSLPVERIQAFRCMVVWDQPGRGEVHFDSADIGEPALGYIVENLLLQQALDLRLDALEGVEIFRPASVESIDFEISRVVADVAGTRVSAKLVVGADGTSSRVRELAGIDARKSAYGQRALVATVATEKSHEETAWQRFLPAGPLAFLPLPRGQSSIVWSTTPSHARELEYQSDRDFGQSLAAAYEGRLGEVTAAGARGTFELVSLHAGSYVRHRIVLVGDAAHTVHPLAGQGVNLGILDAAALTEVLTASRDQGRDPGRLHTLRKYERWRKGHNVLMRETLGGFNWLFGAGFVPLRQARNAGLQITDRIPPLKRWFMAQASGLSGDLPPLARRESSLNR
ncbi:MAG TPA: UbiH/UbiF/VisC/COQ6 family ubiquinone biosynthesis hydroxylase [Gammaproteobacteria bacterium]